MVKRAIPGANEGEPKKARDLSCTFCGPGTWAMWEVITEEGVVFACDRHHAEMSQAKFIWLERMRGKEVWEEIREPRSSIYEEENQESMDDFIDQNEYE